MSEASGHYGCYEVVACLGKRTMEPDDYVIVTAYRVRCTRCGELHVLAYLQLASARQEDTKTCPSCRGRADLPSVRARHSQFGTGHRIGDCA
jgi:hypothetical protein